MIKGHLWGEMGDPGTHHIEDAAVGFEAIAIEMGELVDESIIHMGDKSGVGIE